MCINQSRQNGRAVQIDDLTYSRETTPRLRRGSHPGDPLSLNGNGLSRGAAGIDGDHVSVYKEKIELRCWPRAHGSTWLVNQKARQNRYQDCEECRSVHPSAQYTESSGVIHHTSFLMRPMLKSPSIKLKEVGRLG